ncbi:transcriptional regulator [Cronobacter sakazakii]|uniref:transcriptional regulator n=1 Tax=Cronobacter sakazakii TaxID=28141 RepID=UPI000CF0CCD1|nr:transcriptional regulator [Cronobacter sakazakii]EJQ2007752.1 transcriptional regulator [Cronobacter sakazakii]EJQ2089613.1 transcriptional regulator [Cronobacter sakazakii]EJR9312541.1 transcriptional regulator [Cronobacter sakazakii]EJR9316854.1 transcriptional regulator [Cronobacter sakazakii]EJR9321528.1 transcriptional regulator [Cronobacter sakazakii]
MQFKNVIGNLAGWQPCDAAHYARIYHQFGGSICCHPDVLHFLSREQNLTLRYFALRDGNEDAGACFSVNGKCSLQHRHFPVVFDDVLFPLRAGKRGYLPVTNKRLSPHHKGAFVNALFSGRLKHKVAYIKESISKTSEKKRRKEFEKFCAMGGVVRDASHFSSEELAAIYIELFTLRWQGKIYCFKYEDLVRTFDALRHLIFGSVLFLHDRPCAFDIIFMCNNPEWIYFDDINGGYDPQYTTLNLGSILLWLNTSNARALCARENKTMRFSLGIYKAFWSYKKQWCDIIPLGRTFF